MTKSSRNDSVVRLPDLRELAEYHGDSILLEEPEMENLNPEEQLKAAEKRAKAILANAEAKANEMIKAAQKDGVAIKQQAKEDGYLDGQAKAKQEYDALMAQQRQQFASALAALDDYRDSVFEDIRKYIVEMLLYLSDKILRYTFDQDNAVINGMIDGTLESLKEQTHLSLRLSPEDYERLDLAALQTHGVEIIADDRMHHGEMKISCDAENIDIGLDGQLNRLAADLKD